MSIAAPSRFSPRTITRALFALAAVAVTVLSLLPQRDLPKVAVSDKVEHVVAYFALAILGSFGLRERRSLLLLFVLLCAMGGIIELLQAFSPGRSPDVVDAIADGAGAAAGVLIAVVFGFRRR